MLVLGGVLFLGLEIIGLNFAIGFAVFSAFMTVIPIFFFFFFFFFSANGAKSFLHRRPRGCDGSTAARGARRLTELSGLAFVRADTGEAPSRQPRRLHESRAHHVPDRPISLITSAPSVDAIRVCDRTVWSVASLRAMELLR